jgi:hypothetical protein
MENYSYSQGDQTVVEPNIAIQSVTRDDNSGPSVLFSVQKGKLLAFYAHGSKQQSIANNNSQFTKMQIFKILISLSYRI